MQVRSREKMLQALTQLLEVEDENDVDDKRR